MSKRRHSSILLTNKTFLLFVICGFLFTKNSHSQDLLAPNSLIESEFSLTTDELNSSEVISGSLQFYNSDLLLDITDPINQQVFINGPNMTMYYPESNTVLELVAKTSFDLPIISSIIPIFKEDYGLSEIGFILDDFQISNDSTVTTWIPKERVEQNADSYFKLVYVSDQLQWVQHNSIQNSVDIVTQLSNYVEVADIQIPTIIRTIKVVGNTEVIETVELYEISSQISEIVDLSLTIPEDAIRQQYSF